MGGRSGGDVGGTTAREPLVSIATHPTRWECRTASVECVQFLHEFGTLARSSRVPSALRRADQRHDGPKTIRARAGLRGRGQAPGAPPLLDAVDGEAGTPPVLTHQGRRRMSRRPVVYVPRSRYPKGVPAAGKRRAWKPTRPATRPIWWAAGGAHADRADSFRPASLAREVESNTTRAESRPGSRSRGRGRGARSHGP